jgi:Cu/Ag efflux pump CusA
MVGAFVIILDPIFQGLAVSLLFGVGASTVLTLIVIPVLYYRWIGEQPAAATCALPSQASTGASAGAVQGSVSGVQ